MEFKQKGPGPRNVKIPGGKRVTTPKLQQTKDWQRSRSPPTGTAGTKKPDSSEVRASAATPKIAGKLLMQPEAVEKDYLPVV